MKLDDGRFPASDARALGGVAGAPALEGREPVREEAGLESVWPRRFGLEDLRTFLGEEADQALCDVIARRVSAPIWDLADRGGRRWRPAVSRLAFLACGGAPPVPAAICQVAELLHTASLIVDDIQDGAAERRGGSAAHVVHGIPAALGAANAAYFRAFEILRPVLPGARRLRALEMLAEEMFAAHLGQALDLGLEPASGTTRSPTAHYVVLARAKTGALVRIAARLGAIAANAHPADEAALCEWASELGVAYQIHNDLRDVEAAMRDVAAGRPTYPVLLVLEDGGRDATVLRAHLGRGPRDDAAVRELRALFARARVVERGRTAARRAIGRALEAIRRLPAAEPRAALARLTRDLTGERTHA